MNITIVLYSLVIPVTILQVHVFPLSMHFDTLKKFFREPSFNLTDIDCFCFAFVFDVFVLYWQYRCSVYC